MKHWLITLSFAFLASAAHALPTVTEVQAEIQKGNYAQAQTMMREVVVAKPGNAKAHYIYAEILAHNARFADSAEQARLARELDPAIKFTSPEKFRAFEQLLEREQQRAKPSVTAPVDSSVRSRAAAPAAPAPLPERSQGVPSWVWIAGLAGLGFVAWRMLSNRKAANSTNLAPGQSYSTATAPNARPNYGAAPIPNPGQNFGPGAVPGQAGMGGGMMGGGMGGGMGSGMMGVGLGVAGGLAAGMLAEKLLHGGHDTPSRAEPPLDRNSFADNPAAAPERNDAAQALEDRSVDFGNGNDWGDAGSSDAGSVDMGSGGGDDW